MVDANVINVLQSGHIPTGATNMTPAQTKTVERLRGQPSKDERIDSTAFRRGVRAFKTGKSNPYNGPELRDEWEAGRAYAARK